MEPSSSSNTNAKGQIRQRRVLPSRSRRGGPGVGSCDIDLMILDNHRRKLENEPVIPVKTTFLLTTNSALAGSSSEGAKLGINSFANERYFDRPEVLKAYREQLIIQTPEFVSVADNPSVGGRFRPRGSEDSTADTSDSAYEKRHRKYETFEKRQRLREKEKLKHEHYKLKERIEQLRAMDGSAFLAVPASSFSPMATRLDGDELDGIGHTNGTAGYTEGERRRREMLEVALGLEERYRALLPPDRTKKTAATSNGSMSVEPDASIHTPRPQPEIEEGESIINEEPLVESVQAEVEKIKLKIRLPTSNLVNSTSPFRPTRKPRGNLLPLPVKQSQLSQSNQVSTPSPPPPPPPPPQLPPPSLETPPPAPSVPLAPPSPPPPMHWQFVPENIPVLPSSEDHEQLPPPFIAFPPSPAPKTSFESVVQPPSPKEAPVPETPMSNPDIAVLEPTSPEAAMSPAQIDELTAGQPSPDPESISAEHRPKRRKHSVGPTSWAQSIPGIGSISADPSIPHAASSHPPIRRQRFVEFSNASGQTELTTSHLIITASRSSSTSKMHKSQRNRNPFGAKLPAEVEVARDYELPEWVRQFVEADSLTDVPGQIEDALPLTSTSDGGDIKLAEANALGEDVLIP